MSFPRKMEMSAEFLRKHLAYDPTTGNFTRLKGQNVGKHAGYVNYDGYVLISISNVDYRAHHLAWLHFYGEPAQGFLDHMNGDRGDNRIVNLRSATRDQNNQNRASTSGFKGVSWSKQKQRWRARIQAGGRRIELGRFATPEAAHAAYAKAAAKLHGEFARSA